MPRNEHNMRLFLWSPTNRNESVQVSLSYTLLVKRRFLTMNFTKKNNNKCLSHWTLQLSFVLLSAMLKN